MSVLIKGMEMPKYCIECKFCGSGSINEFEFWCGLTGSRLGAIGDIVLWEDMCAEDCPLVEVPTPHGRLIDADVFDRHMKQTPRYFSMCCDLEEQPTIIEAEKGEKE